MTLLEQVRDTGDPAAAELAEAVRAPAGRALRRRAGPDRVDAGDVGPAARRCSSGSPTTTSSASLLLLHDLHPVDVADRVVGALDHVRPYLGSHAGGIELLGVDDDGVAHLRLEGSCDGCPSSAVTLQLAVERAVLEAARRSPGWTWKVSRRTTPPDLLQMHPSVTSR